MNFESLAMLIVILLSGLGCLYFIRISWKRYGLLYLLSASSANLTCYLLTAVGFYRFPNNVLHGNLMIPYGLVSTVFPLIAILGVRFSPARWVWKLAYYWPIVHLGLLAEILLLYSSVFQFEPEWDLWDSYTLWWIYYLFFEFIGGKILPDHLRAPIPENSFRYGGTAWILVHVILVVTIFLAGVYTGVTLF